MGMKMHAYLREKVLYGMNDLKSYADFIPKFAKDRGCTIEDLKQPKIDVGSLGDELPRFTYFFFCPSLVYRDEYPRKEGIRYDVILKNLF